MQTVKKYYSRAANYCKYRQANQSTCQVETVSSYISKMVKEVKLQTKIHFFDRSDAISIIELIDTFTLVCDANNIHEKAAVKALLFFVKNALAVTLNTRMSAAAQFNPDVASANTTKQLTLEKLLLLYL